MDAQAVSNATAKNGLAGLAISGGLSRQGIRTREQDRRAKSAPNSGAWRARRKPSTACASRRALS